MKRLRISTRLLLSYLLVGVLPLAGLALFHTASFENALRETVLSHLDTIADKNTAQIDTYLSERMADVQLLSRRAIIRDGMAALTAAGADAAIATRLRATLRDSFGSTDFHDLLLIDTAGNVVFSIAQEAELGSNLTHGPYRDTELAKGYARTLQTRQPQLSRFAPYAPSGNRPAAFLLAPVLDGTRMTGVLALQLDVNELAAVTANRIGLGDSGEIVLAQQIGNDVYFTAPLRHVRNAAYRHRVPLPDTFTPLRAALAGEHGRGIARDYAGREVAAAWHPLPRLGWGMVVKIDADEALAPAIRLRNIAYTSLALLLALSGLAAFLLGRGLSGPIQALTQAADRVAAGDLAQRTPRVAIDELDRLSATFNHMTEALAASHDSLEAKVAARSQELRAAVTLQDAIFANAGALMLVLDRDGRITRFNQACETLTQYRFDEVRGRFVWDLFLLSEEREPVRTQAFLALAEQPQALRGSYTNYWVARDGTRHLIDWSNTVLLDEQGRMQYVISIGVDVTDKAAALAALKESERRLNEAQRIAQVGSWELDLDSGRLAWSDEIFRLFEIDQTRFGASYEAFLAAVHPDDRTRVGQAYDESVASHAPYEIAHRLLMADGRIKWVNERGETHYDAEGKPIRSTGTVQDITERRQAEEALRLYASVFQHSGEAILITDRAQRILAVNPAFTRLTGYSVDEIRGKSPGILASGGTPPATYEAMWAALNDAGHWQGEIVDRRKDGSLYPKWLLISAIRGPDGDITHYVGSFTDITERKLAEAQISELAYHDALTQLLNRFSLQHQLDQALAMAQRDRRVLAVAFLDLDRFKTINDTMGHAMGDKLLIEVARRLRANLRHSDIVARFGGDEFVFVLTEVEDATAVARVAHKILETLAQPYHFDDSELHTSASIGVALFPGDGGDGETLMKNADVAMYHAKSAGRNNVQFFTAAMNQAALERLQLDNDLRTAVEAGQFELHYQPQLDSRDGRVVGVEALVRWRHPHRGLLMPGDFIPAAEDSGLILQIGSQVLDEACRQLRAWQDAGLRNVVMAVNLSAHQLRSPDLLASVADALEKYGLDGADLELEITESVAMHDPDTSVRKLKALRDLGVRLSIDDFGTGYSSLSYLKLLPIQTLKLDQSFVRDIESDSNDVAICTATIALAHSLGLTVVAEGVETEAQRLLLASHQCDFMQGYLFSRPLPAEAAQAFMLTRRAA